MKTSKARFPTYTLKLSVSLQPLLFVLAHLDSPHQMDFVVHQNQFRLMEFALATLRILQSVLEPIEWIIGQVQTYYVHQAVPIFQFCKPLAIVNAFLASKVLFQAAFKPANAILEMVMLRILLLNLPNANAILKTDFMKPLSLDLYWSAA